MSEIQTCDNCLRRRPGEDIQCCPLELCYDCRRELLGVSGSDCAVQRQGLREEAVQCMGRLAMLGLDDLLQMQDICLRAKHWQERWDALPAEEGT